MTDNLVTRLREYGQPNFTLSVPDMAKAALREAADRIEALEAAMFKQSPENLNDPAPDSSLLASPWGKPVTPADAMRLTEEIAAIIPTLYLDKQDDAWYIAEVVADWLIDTGHAAPRGNDETHYYGDGHDHEAPRGDVPTRNEIAESLFVFDNAGSPRRWDDQPMWNRKIYLGMARAVLALLNGGK